MRTWSGCALLALSLSACARAPEVVMPTPAPTARPPAHAVIPVPSSIDLTPADTFTLDTIATIAVTPGNAEAERIGRYLAEVIGTTVATTPRVLAAGAPGAGAAIELSIDASQTALGDEGYDLAVTRDRVRVVAREPAGLFYGVQTLRQLFPARIEHTAALPRAMKVPGARITDRPRFAWRGMMLDVSRHFIRPDDIKRFIDHIAIYKVNRLHLHLSDDQGWRVEIPSWPNLTRHGGSTEVGGRPSGYYTRQQYAEIVRYARERFVTVVPEIDMPGHTNAALASVPELNCDGAAPPLYTGIEVGFSALCVDKDMTYRFIDDVVREISELTPGEYFHIGGDEVERLTHDQYRRFIERVQGIVQRHGKRTIGWGEIAPASLPPSAIVQHWRPDSAHVAVARGSKVILSPARHVYLDMKYDSTTTIGLNWAAFIEVRDAYEWEPATYLDGVPESAILGVEAPLWSETLRTVQDFEYMAFPRLLAVAELGWAPAEKTAWEDFRQRLAAHGPRLAALGINFYRSPQVPWVVRAGER